MLLGLDSEEDTMDLLLLLGLSPGTDGRYQLDADKEGRILRLAALEGARASLPFAQADAAAEDLRTAFSELLDHWLDEPGA
jgi:hypothetical protein